MLQNLPARTAALKEALDKAENQAIRYKERVRDGKRKPKGEKHAEEPELARSRRPGTPVAAAEKPETKAASNGKGKAKPVLPVTAHSFPAVSPSLSRTLCARQTQ